MKIVLIIALFISSNIFALNVKVKIKQYNNVTHVKSLYKYDKKNSKLIELHDKNYITNIKAKVSKQLVFGMKLSQYISVVSIIKFKYKTLDANYLHLEIQQMNHKLIKFKKKIHKSNHDKILKAYPDIKIDKNVKKYKLELKELKKMYGDVEFIESGVELIAPDVASWGGSIPVTVRSSIEAKSVRLFVQVEDEYINIEDAKESDMFVACEWTQTPYSIVDYQVRIRLKYSGYIRVVIEAKDGKFYTARRYIVIAVAGTNI